MTKEGKFGLQEAICLLFIASTAKLFYTSPVMIARAVGTAGWYMTLISAVVAAVGFTFVYFLLKRFPGKNIMEVYDAVLGKYIGFVFSLLLAVMLLVTAAFNLREYIEVLKIYIFVKTQPTFLIGFFIVTVAILSFLGLESMARYSKLVVYMLLAGYVLLLILASQYYQFHRLFPIFGNGLGNIIFNGLARSSEYGEIIIVAIFAKSLHGIKEVKKTGYISLIFSGILISVTLLVFTLTFSYYFGKEITAPLYAMTSLINYGLFFQRVEAIFLFIWNISTLIAVTVLFYMVLLIYCHLFRIDDKRPVIIPFAVILFTLSMIPSGIADIVQRYSRYLREYSWTVFYILPAAALIIAVLRKKKGEIKNV